MNRRQIGILLVVGVIIIGASIQWLGPGLVVTHPIDVDSGGYTLVHRRGFDLILTYHPRPGGIGKETSIRLILLPLVLLGIYGAVLAISRNRRSGTNYPKQQEQNEPNS